MTTRKASGKGGSAAGPPQPIHQVKADFFRVLGHPARVRILELLRDGEHSVGELQASLEMDSSGTSQHLGALRKQGVLESRREGSSVFYRVKDPRTFQLLEMAREILSAHFEDAQVMLGELAGPGAGAASKGAASKGGRRPRGPA